MPKRLARRRPQARSSPVALWSGRGTMSSRLLEGLEAAGVDEAGADEHVLVGEGQHGPAELVGHQRLEHGVALGGALRPTPGR